MRTFIAIEIPDAIKAGMAAAQVRLRSAGVAANWSRPEGSHLTLKFLGETSEEQVPQIMQALTRALGGTEGFLLRGEGVGTFPNPTAVRVVWCGIGGDVGRLGALQAAVEQAMVGLGLAPDDRPYTPHLTLGRVRRVRRSDLWLKGLAEVRDFKLPEFAVTAVSLIKSEFGPTGVVYRELGKVPLRQGRDPLRFQAMT